MGLLAKFGTLLPNYYSSEKVQKLTELVREYLLIIKFSIYDLQKID